VINVEQGKSDQAEPARSRRGSASSDDKVRSFYELLDKMHHNGFYSDILGIKSFYVNFGYWAPGCEDHDEACEALAEELGEAAGITAGDHVLDVGFGYAEQDFYWLRTRKPEKIVGINVTPSQVRAAQQRAEEMEVGDRLDLRIGSATSLPFEDGSFDRVVALEASVHFDTRQKFFEEAFRVLRPGGVLATTDPLPPEVTRGKRSLMARFDEWRRRRIIPDDNWYPGSVYAERLKRAGFVNVDVRDITDRVFVPNAAYVREHCTKVLQDPRFNSFKNRIGIGWHLKLTALRASMMDYTLTVAVKPGTESPDGKEEKA
jgi:erythromycin 3''-O-methyltransferase